MNAEKNALKELEKQGWIVRVQEATRGLGGRFTSVHYRLLEHDEYVAAHPNSCPPERYTLEQNWEGEKVVGEPENIVKGRATNKALAEYAKEQDTSRLLAGLRELSNEDREKIVKHLKERHGQAKGKPRVNHR